MTKAGASSCGDASQGEWVRCCFLLWTKSKLVIQVSVGLGPPVSSSTPSFPKDLAWRFCYLHLPPSQAVSPLPVAGEFVHNGVPGECSGVLLGAVNIPRSTYPLPWGGCCCVGGVTLLSPGCQRAVARWLQETIVLYSCGKLCCLLFEVLQVSFIIPVFYSSWQTPVSHKVAFIPES